MTGRLAFCLLILVSAAASSASAEEDCNAVLLQQDIHVQHESLYEAIARQTLTDESSSNRSNSGSSATIPIDGVPVAFSSTQDDDTQRSILAQTHLSFTHQQASDILEAKLGDNARDAYVQCLAFRAHQYQPFQISVKSFSADQLVVVFSWWPSGSTLNSVPIHIVDVKGLTVPARFALVARPNSTQAMTFIRTGAKSGLFLNAEAGGYVQSISVPYLPSIQVSAENAGLYHSRDIYAQTVQQGVPAIVPVADLIAPAGTVVDPGSIRVVYANGYPHDGCGDASRSYIRAEASGARRIQIEARAVESSMGCGAAVAGFVEYSALKPVVLVDGVRQAP